MRAGEMGKYTHLAQTAVDLFFDYLYYSTQMTSTAFFISAKVCVGTLMAGNGIELLSSYHSDSRL
jgi:hypothetical protein